ncbi:MAG: sialidase family protein [Actinomycetota bacterium]
MKLRSFTFTSNIRRVASAVVVLVTGLLILPAVPAHSSVAGAPTPSLVSGADPLPAWGDPRACGSAAGGPYDRHDWEQESTLAVNPTNESNVVSAWIQDWGDAIGVGSSSNGGRTWTNVTPPTSICTPGGSASYDIGAYDPSVAFGLPFKSEAPRGVAYLSSVAVGTTDEAILVNRSVDGGRTWSQPTALDSASFPLYVDGSNVVADPRRPGYAYAVWRKGDAALATRNQWVSRTTDGGLHWSAPSPILSAQWELAGQLAVLSDGSLVDVFSGIAPPTAGTGLAVCGRGPSTIWISRSPDLGSTWLPPTPIALGDPDLLTSPSVAVTPDGGLSVAWQRAGAGASSFDIMAATSTDGGLTWRTAVAAHEPGPPEVGNTPMLQATGERCLSVLATPNIAANEDGTLGVAFYSHRGDPGNPTPKVTDLYLRTSSDGGATWPAAREVHLAGPFDQTQAPSNDGALPGTGAPGFIGDYQGLVGISGGFAASFTLAAPLPGANFALSHPPTDIFFSEVALGRQHPH